MGLVTGSRSGLWTGCDVGRRRHSGDGAHHRLAGREDAVRVRLHAPGRLPPLPRLPPRLLRQARAALATGRWASHATTQRNATQRSACVRVIDEEERERLATGGLAASRKATLPDIEGELPVIDQDYMQYIFLLASVLASDPDDRCVPAGTFQRAFALLAGRAAVPCGTPQVRTN
eukprot:scaffold6422_cov350-Prasinococcus_capsulatus_cf.AAC.7